MLNANFEIINGYGGTANIRGPMERGEVDGNAGWSWSPVAMTAGHWLEEGYVNVIYYCPERNREMDERGVSWVFDFPIAEEDRQYINTVFVHSRAPQSG